MKQSFYHNKLLTGIIAALLGTIGGIAAASYTVGSEKTKITQKLDNHDQKFIEIASLVKENSTSTNIAIKEINESIKAIEIDIAILKANSIHK